MANRNGQAIILVRKDAREVQSIILDSREWIIVLTCVKKIGQPLSNFYIFKEVRNTKSYTSFVNHELYKDCRKKVGWTLTILDARRIITHSLWRRKVCSAPL